jgi:hypothetical protein
MVEPEKGSQDIVLGNILSTTQAEIEINRTGDYQVNGYVEDVAGNRTPVTAQVSMDMIAPSIQFKSPDRYSGDIQVAGEMADANSGIDQVWVDFGNGWQRADFNQGNWSSLWNSADVRDGEYTVQARAMDKAGNLTTVSYPVTVLNHTWPIYAICGVLLSLGLTAMYDPRKRALRELTLSTARYAHMDHSARELERKLND